MLLNRFKNGKDNAFELNLGKVKQELEAVGGEGDK